MCAAGALRGVPASTTSDRRGGPGTAPAPPTGRRPAADDHYVVLAHVAEAAPARARRRQQSLPFPGIARCNGSVDDARRDRARRSTRSGPRLKRLRAAARRHADRARRRRPASPRARCRGWRPASGARAWSCCCRSRRPTACRWTTSSARPRSATRGSGSSRSRSTAAPSLPLTRQPGGVQAWKIVIPRRSSRARAEARTRATSGCTSSPAGCGWSSATTTWCSAPARWPSSTPGCRTGSAAPATSPAEVLSLFGPQGERLHARAKSIAGQGA